MEVRGEQCEGGNPHDHSDRGPPVLDEQETDADQHSDPDHQKSGYYFTIAEAPGSTRVVDKARTCNMATADPKTGFFATAAPAEPGSTGTRFFSVDETSLIRQGTAPLADSKSGSPVQ